MELVCNVKNYDWGCGVSGLVAKIAQKNTGIASGEGKPYAEFWMGTHSSGPSIMKERQISLTQYVSENPLTLGNEVRTQFGDRLPFLFKILSVSKALSIQVHPSKSEAEELNRRMPDLYKDPNHKPELAIALTEFRALCSFRPLNEIRFYLENVDEFELLIDRCKIKDLVNCTDDISKTLLKDCFSRLMSCPADVVMLAVDKLVKRLQNLDKKGRNDFHYDLVMKLNDEFPGDVGIFCIYWMNYIVLKPGEAIYLAANEPHAYLSGDCVECMANSDNVVRAGLTPKLKDVTTLCEMLSYKNYNPVDVIFKPVKENEFSLLFSPPVRDFAVAKVEVPAGNEYKLLIRQSSSILIVVNGKGVTNSGASFGSGSVFYLPSNEEFYIKSQEDVMIFQAFCNVNKN